MKKILTAVLALVLLLPIIVRADATVLSTYYNHSTTVGGKVEESIVFGSHEVDGRKLSNFVIEYDTSYLSKYKKQTIS